MSETDKIKLSRADGKFLYIFNENRFSRYTEKPIAGEYNNESMLLDIFISGLQTL